jgi:hypothetical protein
VVFIPLWPLIPARARPDSFLQASWSVEYSSIENIKKITVDVKGKKE